MVVNRIGIGVNKSIAQPTGEIKNFSSIEPNRDVYHIPYGVRSDIVEIANKLLAEETKIAVPESSRSVLCPVYHNRFGGVRYFWYKTPKECPVECQDTQTRAAVSTALLELQAQTPQPIMVAVAGSRAEAGRSSVQESYVLEMIHYKIVVVAQRDYHEDHYRLMEALTSGALVLSDPMLIPPKYMVDGQHYVVYSSMEDLKEKIKYYLDCPGERLRIAYKGWHLAMTRYRSWHMMERLMFSEQQQHLRR